MTELFLSVELAERLACALLAICRVDGEVTSDELVALRDELRLLPGTAALDEEWILQAAEVTPHDLAAAARSGHHAYRATAQSPMPVVAEAFVGAALRIASIAGSANPVAVARIRAYAAALGGAAALLERLDVQLAEPPLDEYEDE